MKKRFALGSFVLASILLLTACGGGNSESSSSDKAASKDLVVSTFGLSEDIIKSDIMVPFEKEFGAKITLDVGNSGDRFTKLVSNPKGIDVIELAQANSADGASQGLFEKLDESKIPNLADLTSGAKEVFDSGAGVPIAVNSVGIVYDKEKVGKEITDWSDLWDSSLKGKISIPEITTTAGPLMMYIASDYAGKDITEDNGEAAFGALEELKPNIVKTYAKSSDLANMFQAGEIEAAIVMDFAYDIIKGDSETIEYVVPESGTYANYNTVNIPVEAANKELAYEFVNYRISADSQKTKALSLNEAPTNGKVELTDEEAGNMTYGAIADRAKTVDFEFVNEQLTDWIDQWNRLINQ
ncbi:ABC transporter substrate-binding protein [Enterococcus sp. BWB1-3]|uniref:ABC transporter substrate-binding protein n=1 Tax=unclassified Enterococcus TaxID=2608891 RepID=UPI001922CC92|nr:MULTISPECIES: ABC transporter substrate-binding protein [unclassified Enterococcus]MBL1228992.1 ABC transporter substrate-binding protein [Enterococcus sp. BWB1-3]MCB5952261.1 ABC transporter substrate-binding protein [Enterococcus sp. BWT-B8]MCB5955510.1 ABC transporter substrate-binding protein [Enterococcus sp. CWB-B31]